MSQNPIDPALLAQLSRIKQVTAIRDEKGEVLGHYVPIGKVFIVPRPEDRCPYSPEELSRAADEPEDGMTLAEFWKQLGVK